MSYRIKTTKRFDKELKRCAKRGYNMHLIFEAIYQHTSHSVQTD